MMTYPQFQREELLKVARRVADGVTDYRRVLFERRPGYCARFIRQLFEAVLGLPSHSWEFRADSATGMAKQFYRAGKKVPVGETLEETDLQPGDLLFWTEKGGGIYGHVALYVGEGVTIENTTATGTGVGAIKRRALTPERLRTCTLVARVWE